MFSRISDACARMFSHFRVILLEFLWITLPFLYASNHYSSLVKRKILIFYVLMPLPENFASYFSIIFLVMISERASNQQIRQAPAYVTDYMFDYFIIIIYCDTISKHIRKFSIEIIYMFAYLEMSNRKANKKWTLLVLLSQPLPFDRNHSFPRRRNRLSHFIMWALTRLKEIMIT